MSFSDYIILYIACFNSFAVFLRLVEMIRYRSILGSIYMFLLLVLALFFSWIFSMPVEELFETYEQWYYDGYYTFII